MHFYVSSYKHLQCVYYCALVVSFSQRSLLSVDLLLREAISVYRNIYHTPQSPAAHIKGQLAESSIILRRILSMFFPQTDTCTHACTHMEAQTSHKPFSMPNQFHSINEHPTASKPICVLGKDC